MRVIMQFILFYKTVPDRDVNPKRKIVINSSIISLTLIIHDFVRDHFMAVQNLNPYSRNIRSSSTFSILNHKSIFGKYLIFIFSTSFTSTWLHICCLLTEMKLCLVLNKIIKAKTLKSSAIFFSFKASNRPHPL